MSDPMAAFESMLWGSVREVSADPTSQIDQILRAARDLVEWWGEGHEEQRHPKVQALIDAVRGNR